MKVTLLQAGGLVLVWIVISVALGTMASRFFGRLRDLENRVDVNSVLPESSRAFRLDPQADIVDETGDVAEDCAPIPAEHWSSEALDALWATIHDGEAFDVEMDVYELRSEIDLVGVAGFKHRWWWRGQKGERPAESNPQDGNSGKES
jgi:hypothetical protein